MVGRVGKGRSKIVGVGEGGFFSVCETCVIKCGVSVSFHLVIRSVGASSTILIRQVGLL